MIVLDSSAIVTIFEGEPEALDFSEIIAAASHLAMSAVNVHETATVLLARRGAENAEDFRRFLRLRNIAVVAFDEVQAHAASDAYRRYGKGFHAKARLNLADCAAYALAKSLNAPLLFKGDDFTYTDVEPYR